MLDDPCDFCPAFLSAEECRVVDQMTDGEVVYPARWIANDIGSPLETVRATIKRLRDLGLARWGNLFDDEGRCAGRGTWLNGAGCALQSLLRLAADLDPVEREIERGWILELGRLYPGDKRVLAWNWAYVFRGRQ